MYRDEIEASSRKTTVRLALQEIAEAQGDVDAFIAQYDEAARRVPNIAAVIARRLLAAGRAQEALQAVETAEHRGNGWRDTDWEDARIDVLDALARKDDAQAARWSCFERTLSPSICAPTSRGCLISKTWKPRSGPSSMCNAGRRSFRRSSSSSSGPPWTEPRGSSPSG
jgi:hypothetical protein